MFNCKSNIKFRTAFLLYSLLSYIFMCNLLIYISNKKIYGHAPNNATYHVSNSLNRGNGVHGRWPGKTSYTVTKAVSYCMNDPAYFSESFETLRRASWKCYLMFSRTEFEQVHVPFFSPSILCTMTSHFLLGNRIYIIACFIKFEYRFTHKSLLSEQKHIERYYFQWLSRYTHRIYSWLHVISFCIYVVKVVILKVLYDT